MKIAGPAFGALLLMGGCGAEASDPTPTSCNYEKQCVGSYRVHEVPQGGNCMPKSDYLVVLDGKSHANPGCAPALDMTTSRGCGKVFWETCSGGCVDTEDLGMQDTACKVITGLITTHVPNTCDCRSDTGSCECRFYVTLTRQ